MKKIFSIVLMIFIIASLSACDKNSDIYVEEPNEVSSDGLSDGSSDVSSDEESGLVNLTTSNYAYCNTDKGYYYISETPIELDDGSWGANIMYMDFSTRQEVYLCSDTGCSHNKKSCTSVLCEDEFPAYSSRIFAWNNKIYILSKDYDEEGTETIDFMGGSGVINNPRRAVLYSMNQDGTNREKVYTFQDGVTLEDTILASDDSIYFIAKKLESNYENNSTVTTATERKIVQLKPSEGEQKTIADLDTDDGISWRVTGCCDTKIVMEGIAYKDEESENMSYEEWRRLYGESQTVFAVLDLNTKDFNELYRISNKEMHTSAAMDGKLYVSDSNSGDILAIDLENGEQETVTRLEQNNIMGIFSDMLVCQTWDLNDDYTLYFIDPKTGEIKHSTLTNQFNGWSLELICETGDDALVIYDYDADEYSDGSYEIYRYKYALIAKEDLYQGINNFRSIDMTGKGR